VALDVCGGLEFLESHQADKLLGQGELLIKNRIFLAASSVGGDRSKNAKVVRKNNLGLTADRAFPVDAPDCIYVGKAEGFEIAAFGAMRYTEPQ
jgi:hypothetical protein